MFSKYLPLGRKAKVMLHAALKKYPTDKVGFLPTLSRMRTAAKFPGISMAQVRIKLRYIEPDKLVELMERP